MIPLAVANPGDKVNVVRVGGNEEGRQHLADLGFVPGSEVRPLYAAPAGDPRAYLVCDTVIALRQRDAATVAVEAL